MEVRYLAHAKQRQALELIPAWADEFRRIFGRESGGLMHAYRIERCRHGRRRARLGARHHQGHGRRDARAGRTRSACSASPASGRGRWRRCAQALAGAKRVVVLEKSLAVGMGGIVSNNVSASYAGSPDLVHTVIAGLGGRVDHAQLAAQGVRRRPMDGSLEPLTFLDLDHALVERVLAREREQRRSGPIAEGILRDLGVVAAKIG